MAPACVPMSVSHAPLPTTSRADATDVMVLFAPALTHVAVNDMPPRLLEEGDMLLLQPGSTLARIAGGADPWLTLVAPRRFLSSALAGRTSFVVPRSPVTEALRHHLAARAALSFPLDPAPAHFLATAVRELLAAATLGSAAQQSRSVRRDEEMLERIVAHIDAHLGEEVGIAHLCHALGCSRSALYRAAAPAGGLVEVTIQRRLTAIHQALLSPGEHRSIAELARLYGFTDLCRFSRRFRRAFGLSAGQVRATVAGAA